MGNAGPSGIDCQKLKSVNPALIQFVLGSEKAVSLRVAPADLADQECLTFVSTNEDLTRALKNGSAIIIMGPTVDGDVAHARSGQALFKTPQVNLAMAAILPYFEDRATRFGWGEKIHPTAVIDSTAQISPEVFVGPNSYVGAGVKIGTRTKIGAGVVIENGAVIGEDCLLHPLCFVGGRTLIGNRCEIHPHVTIGADGFGYATDKSGKQHKIPQLGRVVLEDDVEVGAQSNIDRATLTETRIRAGTKFDKQCHVAHNCEIGKNSLIAAGFYLAGSSQIGDGFMCGGNVVVADHVKVTDKVMLGGRSTVTNDVKLPGAYAGYPLQPLKENLKNLASLMHLTKMRKQLQMILKKLEMTD